MGDRVASHGKEVRPNVFYFGREGEETCILDIVGGAEGTARKRPLSCSSSSICSEESNASSADSTGKEAEGSVMRRKNLCMGSRGKRIFIIAFLFFLLLLLVIVPLIYFVFIPWEAERRIGQTTFVLQHLKISDPDEHSLQLDLKASLLNTGSFNVKVLGGSLVELSTSLGPMGSFAMPEMHLLPEFADVGLNLNWSPRVNIINGQYFAAFAAQVIKKEKFQLMMKSSVSVVITLSSCCSFTLYQVPFKKLIELDGMDDLKDMNVTFFDLPFDTRNGIALDIAASISNPTVFAMDLGYPMFEAEFEGVTFAEITSSQSISFVSETVNNISLAGELIHANPKNWPLLGRFMSSYLANERPLINIRGVRTVTESGKEASWLNETIKALYLKFPAPPMVPFEMIQSLEMKAISILFPTKGSSQIQFNAHVLANYSLPYEFGVLLKEIKFDFSMTDIDSGLPFIDLTVPVASECIQADPHVRSFESMVQGNVNVVAGQESLFTKFILAVMLKPQFECKVFGVADAFIATKIGEFGIENVSAATDLTLPGMNAFLDPPPELVEFKLVDGSATELLVKIKVGITHKSPVSVRNMGSCRFQLLVGDGNGTRLDPLGRVQIDDFEMKMGNDTVLSVNAFIDPMETALQQSFLANYVSGYTSTLIIRGLDDSSDLPILNDALSKLEMPVLVKGQTMEDRLVKATYFNPMLSRSLEFPTVPAYFELYNSFDVSITIRSIYRGEVYNMNELSASPYIGYVEEPDITWVVRPKETVRFDISFHFGASWREWLRLMEELRSGNLLVRLTSQVQVQMNEFPLDLNLDLDNVPVYWL